MIPQETVDTRLGLYQLLVALYRYPLCQEVLDALTTLDWQGDTPLTHSLRDLQATLGGLDKSTLECLNIEMTRLMEGPGLTPAPPYASYYLNGMQLMGPAAQAARRAYLEWQASPEQGSIPPDHITLELGFLAFLAEQSTQPEALLASLSFLRDHLQPWLPRFCADLEANSREAFFAALARFTHQVVEADEAWLADALTLEPSNAPVNFANN